jgi:hypothetical protein
VSSWLPTLPAKWPTTSVGLRKRINSRCLVCSRRLCKDLVVLWFSHLKRLWNKGGLRDRQFYRNFKSNLVNWLANLKGASVATSGVSSPMRTRGDMSLIRLVVCNSWSALACLKQSESANQDMSSECTSQSFARGTKDSDSAVMIRKSRFRASCLKTVGSKGGSSGWPKCFYRSGQGPTWKLACRGFGQRVWSRYRRGWGGSRGANALRVSGEGAKLHECCLLQGDTGFYGFWWSFRWWLR